jgi:hypothetical protein
MSRHTAATLFLGVVVNLTLLNVRLGLGIYIRAGLGHSEVR